MRTSYLLAPPRKLRALFLLVAFLVALYGAWTPASAAPQKAAGSWQPAVDSRLSSIVYPSQAQDPSSFVSPQSSPADDPLPAPAAVSVGRSRYFSQTAHFMRGAFLTFWETHGATPVLGLPITEPLQEDGLVVQYLERARLEWHPEIAAEPQQQVLLTRLGAIMSESRGLVFDPLLFGGDTPTSVFFPQTGHNLANAFLSYWQRNGGLAVFGYPISEELVEVSPTDGQLYTVQYFERNRFEWHPENPPAFNVQLGLLGVEYARMVALNPLARVLLPAPLPAAEQDLSDDPLLAELVEADLLPAIQALGRTFQFRWVPAVIIEHNVRVEFSEIDDDGIAGAFILTNSRSRPYLIAIPETRRGESLEALASVLAHESTHAYNIISGVTAQRWRCSIEEELRAYMNGLAAWVILRGDGALTQSYEPHTLDAAVGRSVREFNSDKDQLDFDFDPHQGRAFLRELYGEDCGL